MQRITEEGWWFDGETGVARMYRGAFAEKPVRQRATPPRLAGETHQIASDHPIVDTSTKYFYEWLVNSCPASSSPLCWTYQHGKESIWFCSWRIKVDYNQDALCASTIYPGLSRVFGVLHMRRSKRITLRLPLVSNGLCARRLMCWSVAGLGGRPWGTSAASDTGARSWSTSLTAGLASC